MNIVELDQWAAWKFGKTEYRLTGYIRVDEHRLLGIVSEPIVTLDKTKGLVLTENNIHYRPLRPVADSDKIDTMYTLSQWCGRTGKREPEAVTEFIAEGLKKDEALEREENEPRQEELAAPVKRGPGRPRKVKTEEVGG